VFCIFYPLAVHSVFRVRTFLCVVERSALKDRNPACDTGQQRRPSVVSRQLRLRVSDEVLHSRFPIGMALAFKFLFCHVACALGSNNSSSLNVLGQHYREEHPLPWKQMLAYITGSVNEDLLRRIEYLLKEIRQLHRDRTALEVPGDLPLN
jgi:hypothetical protein